MALKSFYKSHLARIDRQLEGMYNDPNAPTEGELATKSVKERFDALSMGQVLLFEDDPTKFKSHKIHTGAKSRNFGLFTKKNFYYRLTDKKEAIIFAARVKNTDVPLMIPKKLGRYPVAGICDFMLYRGNDYSKWRQINFSEPPQKQKAAIYGILSFSHLQGHETMSTTHLHDTAEEVKIAPSVKNLMMATLPNARVLHLPSSLAYLGPLCAPMLERVEIYDCGSPTEECVIHPGALGLCTALTHLTLPPGTKYLPSGLLYSATGLQYLHLPASVENIGNGLVSHAKELKMLQVDGAIAKGYSECHIETAVLCAGSYRHFSGSIEKLTLTGDMVELNQFSISVSQLILPNGLCRLGSSALKGQKDLRLLTLPQSITELGYSAFSNSGIKKLVLPDGIEELGGRAFANCAALESLKLPSALKKLDSCIFEGCTSLKEMALPSSVTEIRCRTAKAESHHLISQTEAIVLDDLRPLGEAKAIDPLLHVHLTAEEGSPAAAAIATYHQTLAENVAKNTATIVSFLGLDKNLTVTTKNLDHITAAIRYLAAVDPQNTTILPKLTEAFAAFFHSVAKKTSVEKDFPYVNYFYDTLRVLKLYGAKEAYDLLQECKLALFDRIANSTKHALKGEKLLAKNTPKAREEALVELVRAYHIYPRSIPVLTALIHWFASDKYLYDTKAPDQFLDLIRKWQGDSDDAVDQITAAENLLRTLRKSQKVHQESLTKEEKRDLYFEDFNQIEIINSTKMKNPTTFTIKEIEEKLKCPQDLSFPIDEKFFEEIRSEVNARTIGSFGSTLEFGKYFKEQKLFAVDMAEAILYPKKRAEVERRIAERKAEGERKWREMQERTETIITASKAGTKTYEANTYSPSSSHYDEPDYSSYPYSSRYDEPDYSSYPYSSQYPYSYHNPYSPITDTERWAHAEVIGIEWDIIDRDYYMDLGIFGDHSL